MTVPILQTKFYVPPVRPGLVSRPRLVERLNAGLLQNGSGKNGSANGLVFARKLTLISAPAGFGKTTLLSAWVGQESDVGMPLPSVVWLSLDEGDNDPVRFLTYLIVALQRAEEHFGEDALVAMQSSHPPPKESLLTALINQISAIPHNLVLVFDDYHMITNPLIHKDLQFLLDHLPLNAHLVIATRSDPPLHLARLRGRGQLGELRQSDLCFTSDEAALFLHTAAGLPLTDDDVAALASRTEGWVAGLQMAALALSAQSPTLSTDNLRGAAFGLHSQTQMESVTLNPAHSVSGFVQAFSGSNRYVLDYLVEEVLNRRPPGTRDFLLQTSILDRLCGPLCDAVCQLERRAETRANHRDNGGDWTLSGDSSPSDVLTDGQIVLEQLENANLFIVPLDSERQWYRYHHLFADLLRQRLRQEHPELVPILHRRASEWYEHNGLTAPAIEHAIGAGELERATLLIERAAEKAWARGQFSALLKWLEAIPEPAIKSRPLLCAYHALALFFTGAPLSDIEARIYDAEQGDSARLYAGQVVVLRALLASIKGDLQVSVDLSQRALQLLPEENLLFRGLVLRNLGATHRLIGDVTATIQAFEKAEILSRKADDLLGTVAALNYGAEMRAMQGRLHEAQALYETAMESATTRSGQRLFVAVKLLVGLADVLRRRNDLEAAERCLLEGLEVASKWSESWSIGAYVILALVRQAQGNAASAREAIRTAQRLAVEYDVSELDDLAVAAVQARLCLAQNDPEAAMRWVEKRGLDTGIPSTERQLRVDGIPYILRELENVTLAWVYMAQERFVDAQAILEFLLDTAEALGRTTSVIEILSLQALASYAQGDTSSALAALRRALSLAEPEGHVRVFLDGGEAMAQLLYEAAARGMAPNYTGKLLALFPDADLLPEAPTQTQDRQSGLIEPLSDRELEVLQLISEGLSNQEIAQRLYLSLHTVKWHAGNIFGKLGVTNRSRAAAKARALGLLDV